MLIKVKLFATFRQGRFDENNIDLPMASSVAFLLKHLNISAEQVGILLVNGRSVSVETELSDNDVVSIFPAIGGG